jgi:hypothetical protein
MSLHYSGSSILIKEMIIEKIKRITPKCTKWKIEENVGIQVSCMCTESLWSRGRKITRRGCIRRSPNNKYILSFECLGIKEGDIPCLVEPVGLILRKRKNR